MNGIILKAVSGVYSVSAQEHIYECKARGSFRKSGVSPLVGDRVEFETEPDGSGVITAVLPRKSVLWRPPVANIDKLFIVSSYENPAPNAFLVDKITAIAVYAAIVPVIVFNKCDMGDFAQWEHIYRGAGFPVYTVSAATGEGIDGLKRELANSVSAFTGNSGVGKSSILNALFGDTVAATGAVSEKLGRGRHTTRHTELFESPFGGFVADTPGFSAVECDTSDYGFKEALMQCFPDLYRFTDDCRFTSCTHTCEKGCGVLAAVERGAAEKMRHESYLRLFEELKDLKPWNTAKRK